MTCYVYCLGINHYADQQINSLKCAENDARRVAAAFEFRYGCHSEYLEERSSEQVIDKISALGQQLQAGDQFIFYFSGHGKVIADEQLLLLPGCKLHLLEEHHACLRWTTLKKITSSQQWQGVQSLFIIDACRLPLEANKAAGIAEFGDDLLLRDPIFVKPTQQTQTAPLSLSLLHSCAPGKSAAEIPSLKAGVFTQAFLDLLKAGEKPPSVFDQSFAEQIAMRMRAIALERGVAGLQQQPVWVGKAMALRASATPAQVKQPETSAEEKPPAQTPPKAEANSEQKPQTTWLAQSWKQLVAVGLALSLAVGYWPDLKQKNPPDDVAASAPTAAQEASSPAASPAPTNAPSPEASNPAIAKEPSNAAKQYALGEKYYFEKNYAEALKWYRKAAEQGNAGAQTYLGFMYQNGYGVKQDYAAAVDWYRKAAAQNNVAAQNNLGVMYDNGYGVKQDYATAMLWFRKAAAQNNAYAQTSLGIMYEFGQGVDKNPKLAREWYQKAAAQGHEKAKANLERLNRQ